MLHKTRALQRASDAASARAMTRRPMLLLGTAAAAALGIALTAGVASAPALGDTNRDATTAAVQPLAPGAPLARIADEAALTLDAAEDAVAAADALSEEVEASGLTVTAKPIDTVALESDLDTLADRDTLPVVLVATLAGHAESETADVIADTAALQKAFTAAKEKKAADDAARAAAEKAAAEAAALASANTVEGAKASARTLMAGYGWGGDQFSCLDSLWSKESGWNYQAYNAGSGATGIPQALPGSKMASAGSDWQSNAATQVAWGLDYIAAVYGTPCSAWGHSQATDWY